MAKVLVRANVAYPDDLLTIIETYDRKSFGELGFVVEIDENAHNIVYLSFSWRSIQDARMFWNSTAGIAHIASWHSISQPEFVYLRTLKGETPE